MDWKKLHEQLEEIEKKLHYHFQNRGLLALAFVHRSYVNENKDVIHHNERLEFLGDSILGLVIADYLFQLLPELSEGDLSYLRSRLVEATSCMNFLQKLEIQSYILLGKGEKLNDGRGRDTILADLFEAVVGAIYLDGGMSAAKNFILGNFHTDIEAIIQKPVSNWKAVLQDLCQKRFQLPPYYQVLDATGPDHNKTFTIAVVISGNELGRGEGPSKKEAQQAAAQHAIEALLKTEKSDGT